MNISAKTITRPAGTIITMILFVILGIAGFMKLPVNLLPDITYPMVKVYVYWDGATPEQIENEVASVVERKIATVDDLDYIESTCEEGVYTLLVNFDYSVDRDVAYQDVLAKMGLVRKELPSGILEPVVFKADPTQLPVVELLVSSDNLNLTQLRTWVENDFQDRFASVKGSAGAALSGGMSREIRVHIDQNKLQGYNISYDLLAKRLKAENLDMTGGRMITTTHDYILRTYNEFQSLDDIEDLVITQSPNGGKIYLRDIATIEDSHSLQRIRTKSNSVEGVRLSIFKQADANTIEVSDLITERVEELRTELGGSVKIDMIYDQAEYVRSAISGVQDSLIMSAILVILITGFFLSGWRRLVVLILSLPVTLLTTIFFMDLFGFSINIFTLGGLVMAMTVVLDNSVVMIENITRIQDTQPNEKHPILKGATQISGAIVSATITFLVLFIPFLLGDGMVSLLFKELAITIAIIIFVSMMVALTVTPMLISLLYGKNQHGSPKKGIIGKLSDLFIKGLIFVLRPMISLSLRFKWLVLLLFLALLIPGYHYLKNTGSEFLPSADDGLITVKVIMPTGTSMEETDRALSQIENVVKKQPYIENYATLAGGKVWGLVTTEQSFEGELNIELVSAEGRPQNTDEYLETLRPKIMKAIKIPGAMVKIFHTKMKGIRQTGQFDIELEVLAPRSESIEDIYGVASSIKDHISGNEFLTALDISLRLTKPEYQIKVDKNIAASYGLSIEDVGLAVQSMVGGVVPTRYKEGVYYYPIRVVVNEREITSEKDIEHLFIYSKSGVKIPLSVVADVEKSLGPLQIARKDQDRMIKVTANVSGKTVGDATEILKSQLSELNMPASYKLTYGGQSSMLADNMTQMMLILLLALFLGYAVMVIYFEDFVKPLIIIIRIPLSLVGISYALYITGTPISITALIGIIMLTGMEINNGILLVSFIDELREQGVELFEAIRQATVARLRPILITDINSLFGLLPLALSIGGGTEMLKPMSVVVIGGLIFGLLLVFIFIPVIYAILYGGKKSTETV
ncbi:MAG: efflux RND transporter permease subunit [Rikenellaceae bacterium]